jgi:hypothetical protein
MESKAAKIAITTYYSVVGFGMFVGACKGIKVYLKWLETRKPSTINSDMYDPIFNICCDTGYLMWNMMLGAVGSGIITATAPVSVPILYAFSEKVEDKTTEKEK